MKRAALTLLLTLLLCGVAVCEVKIEGDAKVKDRVIVKLRVPGAKPGTVLWDVYDKERNRLEVVSDPRLAGELWFVPPGPGVYEAEATVADFEAKKLDRGRLKVTVEGKVPPKPPDPDPEPTPDPDGESPIKRDGLHVLIVYQDTESLDPKQKSVLYSVKVMDYLDAKCASDPDAMNGKAYRVWDTDTNVSGSGKHWQDAFKRERKSLPWILISNHPKGGYEGPLPKSVDETLALLKKYAEGK